MEISPSLGQVLKHVFALAGVRSRRGRPKAWERRLADWALASKVAVPVLGAVALRDKGKLDLDHVAAVALYVMDRAAKLDPIDALPLSGDGWVLAEALERLGLDRSLAGEVSMDDVLRTLAVYWAQVQEAQAEQRAQRRAKRESILQGMGLV